MRANLTMFRALMYESQNTKGPREWEPFNRPSAMLVIRPHR